MVTLLDLKKSCRHVILRIRDLTNFANISMDFFCMLGSEMNSLVDIKSLTVAFY